MTTIVVAYPWNADDELLTPLRERFPELDIVAQPYFGQFGRYRARRRGRAHRRDPRRVGPRRRCARPRSARSADRGRAEPCAGCRPSAPASTTSTMPRLPEHVTITNAAGVAAAPIAEFVMSRLLSVWKRLPEIDELQQEHDWKPTFGRTVEGMTLGIIGLGAIGTEVAVRARAFGMFLIGTRRSFTEGQEHAGRRRAAGHRRPPRRARPLRRGRGQRAGHGRDREPVRCCRLRGHEAGCAVLQRRARVRWSTNRR